MEQRDEVKVTFGPCCFCGGDIAETEVDPCRVTVETAKGSFQVWRCHGACFKERVFPGRYLKPEIF